MLVAQNSLGPVCPVPLTVRGNAFRRDDAPCLLQVTTGAGDWVYLAQALDAVERGVRIESPEALISWTELGRAMAFVVVTVVRLAWWAALKFALCNVLAYCGYRVLGYVLPVLRFFSQIPW